MNCILEKKILLITYDNSDDSEVLYPLYRMREAGYCVDVAALERRAIKCKYHFTVNAELLPHDVTPADYSGLILPGGTAPEKLRQNGDVLDIVRYFDKNSLPIAAICHGPQILISAGVIGGRRATCYPGIRDDLINAGALYEDSEVVCDQNIVTSRRPDDLPAFMREFVRLLRQ